MEWLYYILASSFLFSISFIFRKKILMSHHALEFASFRSTFNLLFLAMLVPFISLEISTLNFVLCLIVGLLSAVAIILRNEAVRHDDVSDISPLGGIGSLLVLVFGVIMIDEIPTKMQLFGILIIVSGTYFLEFNSRKHIFAPFKNLFAKKALRQTMLAMFLISITVIMMRIVLITLNPYTALFYVWLVISLIVIFKDLLIYGIRDFKHLKNHYFQIFIFSGIMFLANIFRMIGLSFPDAKGVLVQSIGAGSLIVITFFGGRVFKENNVFRRTIASTIIAFGVIIMIL